MGRLDGRVAIVTGGAKGIGKVYCKSLAEHGARVVIADIVDGEDLAAEICQSRGAATAENMPAAINVPTDVGDEASVSALIGRTLGEMGQIDILVNNAAIYAVLENTRVEDLDVEEWDRVMAVNVRGTFLMVKHLAPHMIERKSGKIINIGSGLAYKGRPYLLHYVASKGAVTSFTRGLARELGEYNICVNTLSPGFVLSQSVLESAGRADAHAKAAVQTRAFKRDSYPEDLIGALIFLASPESDFVTGQSLVVDGGSVNT